MKRLLLLTVFLVLYNVCFAQYKYVVVHNRLADDIIVLNPEESNTTTVQVGLIKPGEKFLFRAKNSMAKNISIQDPSRPGSYLLQGIDFLKYYDGMDTDNQCVLLTISTTNKITLLNLIAYSKIADLKDQECINATIR